MECLPPKALLLAGLLFFCLEFCLAGQGSTMPPSDSLGLQIESLETLSNDLATLTETIKNLETQKQALEQTLNDGERLTSEQEAKLTKLGEQLESYRAKEIQLRERYESLLKLSRLYKNELETWKTCTIIGIVVIILEAVVIGIVASK